MKLKFETIPGSGGGYQQLAVINNIETLNYSFELHLPTLYL
jgi:hypothetical protein